MNEIILESTKMSELHILPKYQSYAPLFSNSIYDTTKISELRTFVFLNHYDATKISELRT